MPWLDSPLNYYVRIWNVFRIGSRFGSWHDFYAVHPRPKWALAQFTSVWRKTTPLRVMCIPNSDWQRQTASFVTLIFYFSFSGNQGSIFIATTTKFTVSIISSFLLRLQGIFRQYTSSIRIRKWDKFSEEYFNMNVVLKHFELVTTNT